MFKYRKIKNYTKKILIMIKNFEVNYQNLPNIIRYQD